MALQCQHHNKVCTYSTICMHTMQHSVLYNIKQLTLNRPHGVIMEIIISCASHWNNESFLWTGLTSLKRRERGERESSIKIMKESCDNSDDRWAQVPLFPLAGPPLLQNEGFAHWQTPTPVLSPRWMLLCSTQRPSHNPNSLLQSHKATSFNGTALKSSVWLCFTKLSSEGCVFLPTVIRSFGVTLNVMPQ